MIYFADRKFNILGSASATLDTGYKLLNDKITDQIESSNYDGTILTNDDNIVEVRKMCAVGNYILYIDDLNENRYYTITDIENNRKDGEFSFYSDAGGLDLLNEIFPPFKADKPMTVAEYINKFAYDSGFEIGLNEIPDLSRQLKWEGSDTGYKRILSVVNSFDKAEISFSFDVNQMLVVRKYINIHKQRGKQLERELRLNRDIDNIVTTESILNLRTALDAVGGVPENPEGGDQLPPINLGGYSYDDGRYYVDGLYLKDRAANEIWSRYKSPTETGNDEGYIVGRYEYDTLSQSELFNRTLAHLKTVNEPEINYTVSVSLMPNDAKVGDTIDIVDDNDELYLNGRILKKEYSSVTKEGVFTLGDYLIQDSGINQTLQDLADKIASIKSGSTYFPWVRYADDENGTNMSSSPTDKKYMAIIYKKDSPVPSDDPSDYAGKWILIQGPQGDKGANGQPVYTWIKYANTVSGAGMSDSPVGKTYIGLAFNKPTPTASTTPTDYQWSLIKGEDGKQGIQGPSGANGATTYFHIAWADNSTGTVGFSTTVSLGKKYMGTYTDQTAANSTDPTKYKWIDLANSIEVGAANLVEKTNPMTNFLVYQGATIKITQGISVPAWKATDATNVVSTGGSSNIKFTKQSIVGVSASGQSYVASVFIKNNQTTPLTIGFNNLAPSVIVPAGTAQFVSARLTGNGASILQLDFASANVDTNINMDIWHMQIERGTTGTDWKPSTTDFTNSITDLQRSVESILYPIVSPTQPSNAKENQQWWRTDSTGNVTGYFVYHSAMSPQWQPQTIQQSVLNIVALNAVNITGSDIRGTVITGSTVGNTFDYSEGDLRYVGTTQLIDKGIKMITEIFANGSFNAKSRFTIDPQYISNVITNAVNEPTSSYYLSASGLELTTANNRIYYTDTGVRFRDTTGKSGVDFNFIGEGMNVQPFGSTQNTTMEFFGDTPYLDWHTRGSRANDFDVRMLAQGGSDGTNGNGMLEFTSERVKFLTARQTKHLAIFGGDTISVQGQGNNFWLRPNGGELSVANNDGSWAGVRAGGYSNASSRHLKSNIVEASPMLETVMNTPIYEFSLNNELGMGRRSHKIGMILDESDEMVATPDGIDLYSQASVLWKAMQELKQELDETREELRLLKESDK